MSEKLTSMATPEDQQQMALINSTLPDNCWLRPRSGAVERADPDYRMPAVACQGDGTT